MISIKFVTVGNLKEGYLRDAAAEYEKRLGAFCRFEMIQLKEEKLSEKPSAAEINNALEREAAKIMAGLLGSDNEGEESVFATENDIPVWARAGVYAMCSLGVFTSNDTNSLGDKITRADVAEYLYRITHIK